MNTKDSFFVQVDRTLKRFCESHPQANPAEIIGGLLQATAEFAVQVSDVQPGDQEITEITQTIKRLLGVQIHAAVLHYNKRKIN